MNCGAAGSTTPSSLPGRLLIDGTSTVIHCQEKPPYIRAFVHSAGCTISTRKSRRTNQLPNFLSHYVRHNQNGGLPSSQEAKSHLQVCKSVALEEKSHQTQISLPGRTTSTCHKAGKTRPHLRGSWVNRLHSYTRLNRGFCLDLQWWNMFITRWNGIGFLSNSTSCASTIPCSR